MATSIGDVFQFPFEFNPRDVPENQSNICIVAVIGKGRFNPHCSKATCLNPVIDRDVFHGTGHFLQSRINEGTVECFFDSDSKVMYLHLLSLYDINLMVEKCKHLNNSDLDQQNFYSMFQDEDLKHAKSLILLFTLSHIVLLCHPGSAFDLTYLKLFYTLDAIRLKLQPRMSEVLSSISGVPKMWSDFGRVCTPRMLFLFETPAVDIQLEDYDCGSSKSSKKNPPMKKLQNCIEDMIYRILRKTRTITNISNNSLFSVPFNQQFVYIQCRKTEVTDPVDFFMVQMKQRCFPVPDDPQTISQKPKPYSQGRRRNNAAVPGHLPHSAPSSALSAPPGLTQNSSSSAAASRAAAPSPFLTNSTSGMSRCQEQSLKEFLWQHIDMVFAKSMNDNMGRHGIDPICEIPVLETWLQVAAAMYRLLISSDDETALGSHVPSLTSMLDISMRFSENRCNKVLPLAESAYQQDLAPFYITAYHLNKLSKAKRVFTQYARGPAFDKYLMELERSCEQYWKSGRQQCEVLSLTGNLCNNKIHQLPYDECGDSDDHLSVRDHMSTLHTKAACNCGRMQTEKEDPFTHKSANYDFYQVLEAACCGHREHIAFPVFKPTTPDSRAVTFVPSLTAPRHQEQPTHDTVVKDAEKPDVFSTLSELSLALSLGQTAIDPKLVDIDEERPSDQRKDADSTVSSTARTQHSDHHDNSKCGPVRQHSTTEYLPYMIHTTSPQGVLPMFPSFSLCRLGTAGYYSHMMGLELPGFLPGSNFLLPWDIPVKTEQEKWPTVSETLTGGKKRQQRKTSKPSLEAGDMVTTVRVYLGMEYECPRGHRFFCSGPDKIIKVSINSIVKDNASRLVNMDMPLYTPCHCKQPKGCMSQMVRVYMVTPRDLSTCASIRVQINPFIQPHPPPCPQFYPGQDGPLELPPDGLWVLRMPHIYQDELCVYLMPTDHQNIHDCFLAKGMFSYSIL